MTLIINPGSRLGPDGDGWTNTYETAREKAAKWLATMHEKGMTDVELLPDAREAEQRWVFTFRHAITGVEVTLVIDGIDDVDAYCERHVFAPRTYWADSSLSEPDLDDFAADGFEPVRTYRAAQGAG
jgi:hypothetical protein